LDPERFPQDFSHTEGVFQEELEEEVVQIPLDRIYLGIPGIENVMEGGLLKNGLFFIVGPSGTYKSSLAFSICANNAMSNRGNCLYITFDQSRESLISQFDSMGLPLPRDEKLSIIDIGKLRKLISEDSAKQRSMNWFKAIITLIQGYMKDYPCAFLVVDSMTTLCNLSPMAFPQKNMYHFFEEIRALKLTTFMIFDDRSLNSGQINSWNELEFLADGVVVLETERSGNEVEVKFQVRKMRQTRHDRHFHTIIPETNGFIVNAPKRAMARKPKPRLQKN
jgi:KaiC/GvpD/RAD55 family RecA-like ATPase